MKVTLYKIDNTYSVREWTIEVVGDKYRTHYGQKDGQIVTTEWTSAEAKNVGKKNETSPAEQAVLEAKAIVKKQREKGYGDTAVKKTGDVMLAKNYEDYKNKIKFPVYVQPKLDGCRAYINSEGIWSRNHKSFVSTPHIFESLKEIFEKNSDLILDGELFNPNLKDNFNRICSLIKKTKPTEEDLEESKNNIQFWCYDIVNTSLNFSDRNRWLKENIKESDSIKLLRTDIANNIKELNILYEEHIGNGDEGAIIRLDNKYEMKRSKNLLKMKEFKTDEFEIVRVIEGIGNKSKMAGAMIVKNKNGQEFHSNIKGDRTWLKELLTNKDKLIGKMATIQYFNLTPDGICRFPYVLTIRDYE
jgi:DNA ligase-1